MIRDACARVAEEAYEDAGIRGLCAEGRWEVALDAIRSLDVRALVDGNLSSLDEEDAPQEKRTDEME